MRLASLTGVVLLTIACGSEPASFNPPVTAPSPTPTQPPPPSLTGAWNGQMSIVFKGSRGELTTIADLVEFDANLSGSWRVTRPTDNDIRGTITGTVSGPVGDKRFTGSATWDSSSGDASIRCQGRAEIAGFLSANRFLDLTSDGFMLTNCSDSPTQIRWNLSR